MKIKDFLSTFLLLFFKYNDNSNTGELLKSKIILNGTEHEYFKALKKNGIVVIENFYSREKTEKIIGDIDNIIYEGHPKIYIDSEKSDHRIYGFEHLSSHANNFLNDLFLEKISKLVSNREYIYKFNLAAKLEYTEKNLGSGGGWHRDSVGFQHKAMLYLSDVDSDSGPFEYYVGSHKKYYKFKSYLLSFIKGLDGLLRYSKPMVQIVDNDNKKVTFTGKAGTLILFNSSGLHRGSPINENSRYALTNYYSNSPWSKHWNNLLIKN